VHAVRMSPIGGSPALHCTVTDDSGSIALVFLGRRSIAGMRVGVHVRASGAVGERAGGLAIVNPDYEFVPEPR